MNIIAFHLDQFAKDGILFSFVGSSTSSSSSSFFTPQIREKAFSYTFSYNSLSSTSSSTGNFFQYFATYSEIFFSIVAKVNRLKSKKEVLFLIDYLQSDWRRDLLCGLSIKGYTCNKMHSSPALPLMFSSFLLKIVSYSYHLYPIILSNILTRIMVIQTSILIIIMGNTCMGNPRKGHDLMKQKSIPEKRYANYESNKVKKELVVGEVEGAHIKISKSLLTCTICMQNYNTGKREPVIACNNHHTYCRECLEAAAKYNQKCPECRSELVALVRNRDIFQLIEDNVKQLESDKLEVVNEDESTFISLTVNQKNKFIDNFWIEGSNIMKIDDDLVWEGFVSNEVMHRDRESIFTVRVLLSRFNNIEVGVVGKGYQMERNVTCKESVVYHLADGMVLEGLPGRGSEWKAKGTKVSPGKPITVEVRVNIHNKSIAWFQSDQQLGQARLSDYLIQHECVAYIMMSHKDDIIELNA